MYRIVLCLSALALATAGDAPAAPAAPGPDGAPAAAGGPGPWGMLIFLGLMVAFMWFFIIRPQRKEEKRRKEMVEAIKRGDKVVTIGGAHGVVESVGETTIDIKLGTGDSGAVVTFNKGAVSQNLAAETDKK